MLRISNIIFFFLFLSGNLYSQNTLSGKIQDQRTGNPLEFAQVATMNPMDSSMITGGTFNIDGRFRFETSQQGQFLVKVSFICYEY